MNKLLGLYCSKTALLGLSGIGTIPIHYLTMTEDNQNIISSIKFGIKRGMILMTPILSEYILYNDYSEIIKRQKNIPETKITLLLNKFKENHYDIHKSNI